MDAKTLKTCCQEILDWHATGLLTTDGELRKYAAQLVKIPDTHKLPVAENSVATMAMHFVIQNVK